MKSGTNPGFEKLIKDAVGYLNNGQLSEAADTSGLALKLEPGQCEGYFTLAVAAYLLDDLGRALDMAVKGHEIAPECREGCDLLAHLHAHAGNINDSVYFAKIATTGESYELLSALSVSGLDDLPGAIDGTNKTDYLTQARRFLNEENFADAIEACEKELRLSNNSPATFRVFADALLGEGRIGQAISALHAAIHMEPDDRDTHLRLGNAYYRAGQAELASASHVAALDGPTIDIDVLAQISHYRAGHSPDRLRELDDAAAKWSKSNIPLGHAERSDTKDGADSELLRVGLMIDRACLSDELCYIEPLLVNFDRNRFVLSVFSRDVPNDPVADRLKGLCQHWIDIRDMTDDIVIQSVRQARVDILIDATVESDGHRPAVFAARPAPATANWLAPRSGVFSGLYDHVISELDEDAQGLAIDGSQMAEIKGRSPAGTRGHITFAAMCDFARISPQVVRAWSRILRTIPDSRLVLGGVNYVSEDVKRRAQEMFSAFGAVDRIEFADLDAPDWSNRLVKQLEFMVGADIYLDPFPMTGRSDIMRALWCGLPVITMHNDETQGQGAGTVRAAGMGDLVADNPDGYVDKAIAAAQAVLEDDEWRSAAHEKVRSSRMCNPRQWGERFCGVLESIIKK